MIWLSLFHLNPRSREVRRDLGNANELHRTIMRLFPETGGGVARNTLGVLYRVESVTAGDVRILLQSRVAADWTGLPQGYLSVPPKSKPIDPDGLPVTAGTHLRFRLRANPTRNIETKDHPDGSHTHGRHVELRGEEDVLRWLHRKAEHHGFRVIACAVDAGAPDPRTVSGKVENHKPGAAFAVASVVFDGILEVVDPALLRQAVESGIGRGKSYGQGLLSLAPAPKVDEPS